MNEDHDDALGRVPPGDDTDPPVDGSDELPVDPSTGEFTDDPVLHLVRGLQQVVQGQQAQIDELFELLKAEPDGPWNWADLTGDARERLWRRLYDFVMWLEDRYLRYLSPSRAGIPEFPADWYRHPVAVEMLTALMIAHAAAYRSKAAAASFDLVEWHERCLWPTLARLEALGLWNRDATAQDWDGPTQRATRRSNDRFGRWVDSDVRAHADI